MRDTVYFTLPKQGNKYTLCLMLRVLVSISIEDVQLGLSSIALP